MEQELSDKTGTKVALVAYNKNNYAAIGDDKSALSKITDLEKDISAKTGDLRNWDNIQAIKLAGAVETYSPTLWGNQSKALKDYAGNISAGNMGYFNMRYFYVGGVTTALGSADASGLKIQGVWNTAIGAAALVAKTLGNCYNYGGILAVGTGTGAVSYNDYTLSDITTLTHVSYNYALVTRNSSGKWGGYLGRTLRNDTAADITVTEIGIYLPLFYADASGAQDFLVSSYGSAYLVWRELLSSPVTLSPGESYNFAVNFELPTNGG